jgi:hypothetical protein
VRSNLGMCFASQGYKQIVNTLYIQFMHENLTKWQCSPALSPISWWRGRRTAAGLFERLSNISSFLQSDRF